jgi:glycosyltransferase involved in cell wall biosynthesis
VVETVMTHPLISVVIPTHNRPAMLADAIVSVRTQTSVSYEIIVVANGETAASREASRATAVRFGYRYIELDEANRSAARNVGIERAHGEWIALLDDDDLWCNPCKLAHQILTAEKTGADCVFANFIMRTSDGRDYPYRHRPPRNRPIAEGFLLSYGGLGAGSCAIVRRAALLAIGGFDITMRCTEDWDVWRRFSQRYRIVHLDEIVSIVRHHGGNTYGRWRCLFWESKHWAKTIRELPQEQRHLIPRILLAAAIRTVLWIPYLCLNTVTGGHIHRLRWWLRSHGLRRRKGEGDEYEVHSFPALCQSRHRLDHYPREWRCFTS